MQHITKEDITISDGSVSFTMIKIPGGDYWLGETPVTQEMWEAVMKSNPSHFKNMPNNPVENVSCKDALEFIKKLSEETSRSFRLPTVKEWVFAASGGSESRGYRYPGSDDLEEVCWHRYNSGRTQPVKQKLPNEIGLYDMLGNVWEWTADEVDDIPRSFPLPESFKEKHPGRILKGGSCMNGEYTNTIGGKNYFPSGYRNFHIGFRLAL